MPAPSRSARLLLLVDLDGVLYRGADPVPGVAELLTARAAKGDDVVYVTNNSMWYRAEYVARIAALGAQVDGPLPRRPRAFDPARPHDRCTRAGARAGGRRAAGDAGGRGGRPDPRRRRRRHRRRQRLGRRR